MATTTSFEDSTEDNPAWTPISEEQVFLQDVQAASSTMSFTSLGNSVEGNPINIIRVGYPSIPTDAELKAKSVALIIGLQHGDEESGREGALQFLRDMAFTTDPALQGLLSKQPMLFIPTMNPDNLGTGRNNSNGADLNRDWAGFAQPEVIAAAGALRDFEPDIVLDLHEMNSGTDYNFELLQPTNTSADSDLSTLSANLKNALITTLTDAGYTAAEFTGSTGANLLRNSGGLGNSVTILLEASGVTWYLTRKQAAAGQYSVFESVQDWHSVNSEEVSRVTATSKLRGLSDGANQVSFPDPSVGSTPLGYRLTSSEVSAINPGLERYGLNIFPIDGSTDYYVPMASMGKRMLPFMADNNSSVNRIVGDPITTSPPTLSSAPTVFNVRVIKDSDLSLVDAKLGATQKSWDLEVLSATTGYSFDVQAQQAGDVGPWSSTASFTTAEEDGTVTDPATAETPTNLSTTNISSDGARFQWDGVSGQTYIVEYRDVATLATTTVPSITNTYLDVTGLSSSEGYEWRVRAELDGDLSAFTAWQSFTTSEAATTLTEPTNLSTSLIKTDSARFSWTTTSDHTYSIEYRDVSTQTTMGASGLTLGVYDVTGLNSYTNYEWRINATLGTETTTFSAWQAFTTAQEVVLGSNTVTVSVKLKKYSSKVVFIASTSPDLSEGISSRPTATDAFSLARATVGGLASNTLYYYGVRVNGTLQKFRGQFKTRAAPSSSFRIAFSSNAVSGSNSPVFKKIISINPSLFLHLGNITYSDITTDNESLYQNAYDGVLTNTNQNELLSKVATHYVWNDHDYGVAGANITNPTKRSARNAYERRFKRANLPEDEGIYHSFVMGNVRFLMLDTRYFKGEDNTMLGLAQENWLRLQLVEAESLGQYACIASNQNWVSGNVAGTWGEYPENRTYIADVIKASGMGTKTFVVGGEMSATAVYSPLHQTAGDYATGGGANLPVFHAGPLDNVGSSKGGPYHIGPLEGGNRFGTLDFSDDAAGDLTILFRGWELSGAEILNSTSYTIKLSAGAPVAANLVTGDSFSEARSAKSATSGDSKTVEEFTGSSSVQASSATHLAQQQKYNIEYKKVSTGTVTSVLGVASLSYDVASLEKGAAYELRVQAVGANSVSDWTAWIRFVAGEQYNIEYRDVSTGTVTSASPVDAISYQAGGLSSLVDYEWRVQADTGDNQSAWTAWQPFTTN